MRMHDKIRLSALIGGLGSFQAAWGHPGHEHSTGWLAQLLHTVTNWGPMLPVLVVAVAAGYTLWKSNRR
jgi:hypothetical protein